MRTGNIQQERISAVWLRCRAALMPQALFPRGIAGALEVKPPQQSKLQGSENVLIPRPCQLAPLAYFYQIFRPLRATLYEPHIASDDCSPS